MVRDKITLEYYDQNESFGDFFPRKANIIKEFKSTLSGKHWLLLELEEPFTYGMPNEFGNHMLKNSHLLISTRHEGDALSDSEFHVHVVLVPNVPDLDQDKVEIDRSLHVAWCIAKRGI